MKKITDIDILDKDEIMEAIFGKKLKKINKHNNFAYRPSAGYYEENKIKLDVGFVFETPSGRESKIYPYLHLEEIEKGTKSGECNYFCFEETPSKILKKIINYCNPYKLDRWFKGTRLKKYRNKIKYFVITTGSGYSDIFKFTFDDLKI